MIFFYFMMKYSFILWKGTTMRPIYLALGFVFLGLGVLGAFLPVLPATPFLLAASYFLSKGSKRFHQWFVGTKIYKKHLESFVRSRSMTLRTKMGLLSFASSMLLISFFMIQNVFVKGIIVIVMIIKYWYFITRIETIKESKKGLILGDD